MEEKKIVEKAIVDELRQLNLQSQGLYTNIGHAEREIDKLNKKKTEFITNIDLVEQKINSMSDIVMKTYNLDPVKKWDINWETGEVTEKVS